MEQRKLITCCASTDHDGYVMEGYATMREKGHRVAGKGHRVFCPRCKGIYPITDGIGLVFGYAPAVEEKRLLSRRHLHQSVHWTRMGWQPTYTEPATRNASTKATLPEPGAGPGLIFPMRPANRRERLVFEPKPDH